MALRKQKGNMYAFVSATWNPIKGECSHKCKYCYMKDFDLPKLYLAEHEMNTDLSKEDFIFVGSGTDIFADDVPKEWIIRVLEHCRKYPDTKYLFQTKNPKRFNDSDFEFPNNSVFGTTIETDDEVLARDTSNAPAPVFRALELSRIKAVKMVTIEPIMDFNIDALASLVEVVKPSWVNIGADSKGNKLKEPSWEDIQHLIAKIRGLTKIVEKSNLARLKN